MRSSSWISSWGISFFSELSEVLILFSSVTGGDTVLVSGDTVLVFVFFFAFFLVVVEFALSEVSFLLPTVTFRSVPGDTALVVLPPEPFEKSSLLTTDLDLLVGVSLDPPDMVKYKE